MTRFLIGKVNTITENQCITFRTDIDGGSVDFPATPMTELLSYPIEDDEVLIIQPNHELEIFFYSVITMKETVELLYGPAKIQISKVEDKYEIILDNGSSTLKLTDDQIEGVRDNSSLLMKKDSVDITCGSSKIEMSGSAVIINSALKVTAPKVTV